MTTGHEVYVDTSALVKLYLTELGSASMHARARGQRLATSVLAYAEAHATFARHARHPAVSHDECDRVVRAFERDWLKMARVPMSRAVLARIPALCGAHALRGADAIHLASALLLSVEGLAVTFACSDVRLIDAARRESLAVFDPVEAGSPG